MATLDTERLNAECRCVTLDRGRLAAALEAAVGDRRFAEELISGRPNLVSGQPVFLSTRHAQAIADVVAAVERVAANRHYIAAVLKDAPAIAREDHGPRGVFMGYDFHLGEEGPRLIEINTNAGGALINAYLAEAHRSCCGGMAGLFAARRGVADLEARFMASFAMEWQNQAFRSGAVETIAIVDEAPEAQYLFPEFVLFQRMLERNGLEARVLPPEALTFDGKSLRAGDWVIDLVYNRLTDFMLAGEAAAALRDAYAADRVVVTPNPHIHALLANKANLSLLSDARQLTAWGIAPADVALLSSAIPRTFVVDPAQADTLWDQRARYFFKPLAGYGSKGAYRGDKVTRRVWADIVAGGYVAQELVAPSQRAITTDGGVAQLKLDVRAFSYAGEVDLLAARLYQGQTTNFRTPGGGFAPVFVGDDAARECGCA